MRGFFNGKQLAPRTSLRTGLAFRLAGVCAAVALASLALAAAWKAEGSYADAIRKWQADREEKLRADNGWLTLAGRYPLKEGANTFGTGKSNDVIFPDALA